MCLSPRGKFAVLFWLSKLWHLFQSCHFLLVVVRFLCGVKGFLQKGRI